MSTTTWRIEGGRGEGHLLALSLEKWLPTEDVAIEVRRRRDVADVKDEVSEFFHFHGASRR